MAVSWSKGEKHSLNRGEHEKIEEKVNNEDLRSGNYSRIQTQFPEAVYDLGCFSTKLKSMGVRDSLDSDHTHSRRVHYQALSGCRSPFSFCIIKSTFVHKERKKERKKNMQVCSVQTLCSLFYMKNSCALQNISLDFNARESTLSKVITSAYSEGRKSSHYTTRDAQNNKIIFCILHSWKYRD